MSDPSKLGLIWLPDPRYLGRGSDKELSGGLKINPLD
jgi:hypothetical protein